MATKTATDFTLREPNLPTLQDAWHKKRCKEELANAKVWGDSPARIRQFWKDVNRPWVKVVLKVDIKINGKVFARKGDIVWAEVHPANKNVGFLFQASASKAQIEKQRKYLQSAHYTVRIPATRKLATRPCWDGELSHTNIRVELNEAQKVKG